MIIKLSAYLVNVKHRKALIIVFSGDSNITFTPFEDKNQFFDPKY